MNIFLRTTMGLCLLLSACSLAEEASRVQTPDWDPTFALPLVDTEIRLQDIIAQIDTAGLLMTDNQGALMLMYETDLGYLSAGKLVTVPALSIPMPDGSLSVPFPVTGLQQVRLSTGTLGYHFSHTGTEPIQVVIGFDNAVLGQTPLAQVITIPGSGTYEGTLDMKGYAIYLTDGTLDLRYRAQLLDGSDVQVQDFQYSLQDWAFEYVEGYLGQQVLDLTSGDVQVQIPSLPEGAFVGLLAPRLTFYVRNSLGLPCMLQAAQFEVVDKKGARISLLSPELEAGVPLAYPALQEAGTYALTTLTLDTTNARLQEIQSVMPDRLIWDFDALTHPSGDETETGFALDTSRIGITLRAELPLYGKAGQIAVRQTFDTDLSGLETGPLETADLKLWIDNGFPLESAVQAYFLDEAGQVLDSLFADGAAWISGAAVEGSGRAAAPARTGIDIRLDARRVSVLRAARRTEVRCMLATTGAGTIPVAMYADYQIGIRLGVLAGL